MLALTEKANAQEKKSLIKLGELTDKCGSEISLVYDKNGLSNHQIIIDSYAAITKGLLVDLYNDNLTYGEYHKLRQDNVLEFRRAFSNLDEQIASQRAVAAQRAYQNYLLNKPIVCNKIGNTTLCN